MQSSDRDDKYRKKEDLRVPGACAFLPKPFHSCYCMNLSSSSIPKMLAFCIGDFPSCEIYRSAMADRDAGGERTPKLCNYKTPGKE